MTESLQRRFQWLGLWLQLSDPRQGDGAGAAERSYPTSEVRGGGWAELPHVQGAVAVWAQEGLEELLHVQGQDGWL